MLALASGLWASWLSPEQRYCSRPGMSYWLYVSLYLPPYPPPNQVEQWAWPRPGAPHRPYHSWSLPPSSRLGLSLPRTPYQTYPEQWYWSQPGASHWPRPSSLLAPSPLSHPQQRSYSSSPSPPPLSR